jgi:hypothetical protein
MPVLQPVVRVALAVRSQLRQEMQLALLRM